MISDSISAGGRRGSAVASSADADPLPLYWGAYIDGDAYGLADAPFEDGEAIDAFQASAGKNVSIVHWGQQFIRNGAEQTFFPTDHNVVRGRGAIPMLNWNAWELPHVGNVYDMPAFALPEIIGGTYDSLITTWATACAAWANPLFVRHNHEMNGDWYPWSEARNGNSTGEFVQAWRHVHGLCTAAGATNISWVWCPNVIYPGSIALSGLYPGDAYVDWVGMDGYNFGTGDGDSWRTFAATFAPTYQELEGIVGADKPFIICETGSSETGGDKAAWITDMLRKLATGYFPRIRGLVYFNWDVSTFHDWRIETTPAATAAFAAGISDPIFRSNGYGSLHPPLAPPT